MQNDFHIFQMQLKPNPDALRRALALIPDSLHTSERRSVRVRQALFAMGSFALAAAVLFTPGSIRLSPLASAVHEEERAVLSVIAQQESRGDSDAGLDDADLLLAELTQL